MCDSVKCQNELVKDKLLDIMVVSSFFNKIYMDMPEEEFMEALKENADLFNEWGLQESKNSQTGLDLIKTFIEKYEASDYEEVKNNFNKLFIGPGHLFAPPWESVYREEDHTIFGEATLQVRQLYRKNGLDINNLNKEPDDHIGYECAYINFLCASAAAAYEENDSEKYEKYIEDLKEFFNDHFSVWVNKFADNVIEHSDSKYYKGSGYLLKGAAEELSNILSSK
jgi:TorA maturation chaperone TorD